jgi:hypothetical protein
MARKIQSVRKRSRNDSLDAIPVRASGWDAGGAVHEYLEDNAIPA